MLGYAFMGKAHSNAWRQVNHFFPDLPAKVEMHTLCGRTPEATSKHAAIYGWNHVVNDFQALLDNPEIDIIDITSPNNQHAEMAIALDPMLAFPEAYMDEEVEFRQGAVHDGQLAPGIDPGLGGRVGSHVTVDVQVIGRDVQYHRRGGWHRGAALQLEAGQLLHHHVIWLHFGQVGNQRTADVATDPGAPPGHLAHDAGQGRRGGFARGPGDADNGRRRALRKFQRIVGNRDAFGQRCLHQRCLQRHTAAYGQNVTLVNQFHRMFSQYIPDIQAA